MRTYPSLKEKTMTGLIDTVQFITRERDNDVREYNNLPQIYLSGRKVNKIPSGSSDVAATDKLNDFNWDASYMYILVDNSGTAEWRRITLGVF